MRLLESGTLTNQERPGKEGSQRQPAGSLDLLRRAILGEQEARGLVRQLYDPLMRNWIGVQHLVDAEEVIQATFQQFYQSALHNAALAEATDLHEILIYLRRTTKATLLTLIRLQQPEDVFSLKVLMRRVDFQKH